MLKKIKELAGIEKIIFETLIAMIAVSVLYLTVYWMSGAKIAVIVVLFAAVSTVVVNANVVNIVSLFTALNTIAVATTFVPRAFTVDSIVLIIIFFGSFSLIALTASVCVAMFVAFKHGVDVRKVAMVVVIEAFLLLVAFTLNNPYAFIGLLVAATVALGVMILRKRNTPAPENADKT